MPKFVFLRLAVASLFLAFVPAARADNFTWIGATDSDLNTYSNWTTSSLNPPGVNDVLIFGATNTAPTPFTPEVKTAVNVQGLSIDNTGTYKWNLPRSGNGADARTISIGASGITMTGTGTSLITAFVTITTDQTWNISAGGILSLSGGGTLSGTSKLTKDGAGTLVITDVSNTGFSGTVDVVGGVLANGRSTSGLGSAGFVTVFNGATYEVRNLVGNHSLLLNNGSTFRGSGTGVGLTSGGGTFNIATSAGTNVTFSTVSVSDTFTVSRGFGGGTSDSLITLVGPGTIILPDGSSYAGGFKITGGNVRLSGLTNLGSTAGAGRPVELAGGTLRFAMSLNSTGTLTTGSIFTVTANSGFVIERNTTTNTGNTTRTTGALAVNNSTVTIRSGLSMNGAQTAILNFTSLALNGTPTFDIVNGTSTDVTAALIQLQTIITGAITQNITGAGITKTGNGQLRLNGALSYTGPTIINGGTVAFGTASNSIPTSAISIASGATLELNNGVASPTFGGKFDLSGSGTVNRVGATSPVLNLQGSAIEPGDSPTTAGILSITTNGGTGAVVNLQKDGAEFTALTIKITGTGGAAGIDHDRLAVDRQLGTLNNANLIIDASTIGGADLTGQTLTIVTSSTDFSPNTAATRFNNVSFVGIDSATVNYNAGSITVSNIVVSPVPEPFSLFGMGMLGLAALRMNRKRA